MEKPDAHQISGQRVSPPVENAQPNGLTVCLITALTIADFIDPELSIEAHTKTGAQLGVLTLAALLREEGCAPYVLNLDDLFLSFIKRDEYVLDPDCSGLFFSFVIEQLQSLSFDVFGFSSICSSYPLTLRLAQEVKRYHPEAKVILGGPQASVVDVATMQAFTCVDFIVRGEADETFPALLRRLSCAAGDEMESIPGITFRRGDEVIRNHNAPVVRELDRLPLPAFDLDPNLKERGGIHLEIGRGCPFACTFCSTNDFFRRNFRLKSPQKMIDEISFIKKEYGIEYFSLVHDMYTVDRKKVLAFCQAIIESGEQFTWGCSARTDCIDDELIALMASAGCRGIFFGIETGSQRLQQVIHKNLDLTEALKRIECADSHAIHMAVALIVGFPEETRDDLRDTIHFFVDALRFDHAEPQCSLLAPLAATPIYEQHRDGLTFDHIFSDMSHQSWRQDPAEVEMIRSYPEIFPNFYAIPTLWLERSYVKEVMDFATYMATWFRWLPVALLQDSGDLLQVFDRWRKWRAAQSSVRSETGTGWTPYYSHRQFRNDFLEFVETCYLEEMATARAAIAALAQVERAPKSAVRRTTEQTGEASDLPETDSTPYLPENLSVMELEVDYKALIESLRNKANLNCVPQQKSTIVLTRAGGKRVEVWQVSSLSATLLRLCDGRRRMSEIVSEFSLVESSLDGIPAEKVCLFGLMQLHTDGFIGLSSTPVARENDAASNDSEIAPATNATNSLLPPQATNTQQPWPPLSAAKNLSTTD
jgi:radical SAM superfamily enzyme YgiQ (UPF0313 family)